MTRARDTARAGFMTEKTFPVGKNVMFRVNDQILTEDVTIDSDQNSLVAGPLALDSDVTLILNGNLSIV